MPPPISVVKLVYIFAGLHRSGEEFAVQDKQPTSGCHRWRSHLRHQGDVTGQPRPCLYNYFIERPWYYNGVRQRACHHCDPL